MGNNRSGPARQFYELLDGLSAMRSGQPLSLSVDVAERLKPVYMQLIAIAGTKQRGRNSEKEAEE